MSEKFPNRREAMASEIEQGEKYQAIQTLLDLGILKKLSDLELYHGRAGNGEKWQVEPDFDNADNNTGNRNINKIPALNTGDYDTAKRFAEVKALEEDGIEEVHRIVSADPDAMVITPGLPKLSENDQKRAVKAMKALSLGVMEGAPIPISGDREDFVNRNKIIENLRREDFQNKQGFMFEEDISSIEEKTGLDTELVTHIGSAINTQKLLNKDPYWLFKLGRYFIGTNRTTMPVQADGEDIELPFSRKYLSSWFRSNHIVGIQSSGDKSVTLDDYIDACRFFDQEKINTPGVVERRKRNRDRYFGRIAATAKEKSEKEQAPQTTLWESLKTDFYIKPQKIIRMAKETPGFKEVFESDAGNWEGFKLEEHTETVLRLFDDNYADIMPASTLPIIRLALLVHDTGKPAAVRMNDKANQKKYNQMYARKFMRIHKIDDATQKLILSLIGEGMDITSDLVVGRDNVVNKWRLMNFCEKTAKEYLNVDQVDKETITGFENILEILQTCDSAAYTTMGITRARNNVRYRNFDSFGPSSPDSSFDSFTGFTGNRARLKNLS